MAQGDCAFIPARYFAEALHGTTGDIQDEIASTWGRLRLDQVSQMSVSMTQPGRITRICAPTIMDLVGLKDDYIQDGRFGL